MLQVRLPPPYLMKVRDYKNVDARNIQHSIVGTDRGFYFQDTTVDNKVQIHIESLNNIFHKYISHKVIN